LLAREVGASCQQLCFYGVAGWHEQLFCLKILNFAQNQDEKGKITAAEKRRKKTS
jgi:hypothetical protein